MLTDGHLAGVTQVRTASGRTAKIVKVLQGDRQGVLAQVTYLDGSGESGEEWVFSMHQSYGVVITLPSAPMAFNSEERQILLDALKTYLDCFLSSDVASRTKISELIKRVESL